MIKLLSAAQIREWDRHTIEHEPVASIDLMERACRAFVEWLVPRIDPKDKIAIICGTGNNGGDGLGIARLLADWSFNAKVWIVRGGVPESKDFQENYSRLRSRSIETLDFTTIERMQPLNEFDFVIDAIFGSGLSRPVEGIYADAIRWINASKANIISVDVPSGLPTDQHFFRDAVKAHFTVSFQIPKLAFLFPQSYQFVGEWAAVNIGLSKKFPASLLSTSFFLEGKDIRKMLKSRSKFDHKGTYGHVLIIGGSLGKVGALVLATRSALRSGVGLVTAHVPKIGYNIIQTATPEAMASVDNEEHFVSTFPALEKFSTIAIGPGLGMETKTLNAFKNLLANLQSPLVIDADGLNLLASDKDVMSLVPPGSILTPHPKEFERLIGKTWSDDFQRLEFQKELSARLQSFVILKGAFTSITSPDGNVYFNATGNPGMAKGGSGDVLTGLLAGLLAQKYSPLECCIIGVFVHGLAGDLAKNETGMIGMNASDLIDFLPSAFLEATKRRISW